MLRRLQERMPRTWRPAMIVAFTLAIVAAVVLSGWGLYLLLRPSGSVTLDGVLVSIQYQNGSSQPWPQQQLLCPQCPRTLYGGEQTTIFALWFNLTSAAAVHYNLTIWSPIPFRAIGCPGTGPCPLTNIWSDRDTFTDGYGFGAIGFPAKLVVPNPAPDLSGGFWIVTVVEANVVPA